jgi:hypothetical protein
MGEAVPPFPNTPSWRGDQLGGAQGQLYLYLLYRNETNITFQCNPFRLEHTGSRVSQFFFNSVRKKKVFLVASLTSFAPRQFSVSCKVVYAEP